MLGQNNQMKILFIHQNFPGQFRCLAKALADQKHEVRSLSLGGQSLPNISHAQYQIKRGNTPQIDPLIAEFETKIIRAKACTEKLIQLKKDGFEPDLVVAHPGWGESLFVKDVFEKTILINFIEFYYQKNSDTFFDKEFTNVSPEGLMRLRIKNVNNLLALEGMDYGLCPTKWQHSTIPVAYQSKVKVIFDGINTEIVKPNPEAKLSIKHRNGGTYTLSSEDEIVTFVNRNLEPYRGYHSFMRALPRLMKERPEAKILIVGGNSVSYGKEAPEGQTWKDIFLNEVKDQLDLDRLFFLGSIPYDAYLNLLQMSSAHVYLTYPFVLSWSCVEAMSAEALVIGSKTAPVEEFITHEKNGLLVDFFNYDELATTIIEVLKEPNKFMTLRKNARKTVVKNYDLNSISMPKQIEFLTSIIK